MPYESKKDLPDAVKKLSPQEQDAWMAAFNAAYEKYGEESAFKIAWSQTKKSEK